LGWPLFDLALHRHNPVPERDNRVMLADGRTERVASRIQIRQIVLKQHRVAAADDRRQDDGGAFQVSHHTYLFLGEILAL
jgi:hypothetical protein